MTKECKCWLRGLLEGDGYIDQRHVELFNSSESILKRAVTEFKRLIPASRIKVDIYSEIPKSEMVFKWKGLLGLPKENFTLRRNTSPWKSRTEKIRVRIASKDLAVVLSSEPSHPCMYLQGLFDAEASVDVKGYIEFKQKNSSNGRKIVRNVADLMKNLRVDATDVRTKNDRNIKRDVYLYVRDLERYRFLIGFTDELKSKKLRTIIDAKLANRHPQLEDLMKMISEEKTIWDLLDELKSPYHRIRKALKENHLAIRQTR